MTLGNISLWDSYLAVTLSVLQNEIRKSLGICPQHDILFPELTVREVLFLLIECKKVFFFFQLLLISEVNNRLLFSIVFLVHFYLFVISFFNTGLSTPHFSTSLFNSFL